MIYSFLTFKKKKFVFNSKFFFRTYNDTKILKIILHLNFAAPFILTLFWIKPLTREYLTARVFQGMSGPL